MLSQGISLDAFWNDCTTEFINGLIDRHNREICLQQEEAKRASRGRR